MDIKNYYGFIYVTTNLTNDKKYIGQRMFTQGWKYYLGSGTWLKLAIKKYGRENFHRKIVAIAYSKEELDNLEIKWINNYNASNSSQYYNITVGGSGVVGEIERKVRKIVCLNTSIIYSSIVKASNENNIDTSTLIGCCRDRLLSAGKGYNGEKLVWAYYTDYKKMSLLDIVDKIYWANNVSKGENFYKARKVVCLNSKKIFNTVQAAAECYDCSYSHISSCCSGNRRFCGRDKYTNKQLAWAYYEDFVKITDEEIQEILSKSDCKKGNPNKKGSEVICITTGEKFLTAKKAGEYYNVDSSGILKNCNKTAKSAGKLKDGTRLLWQYVHKLKGVV